VNDDWGQPLDDTHSTSSTVVRGRPARGSTLSETLLTKLDIEGNRTLNITIRTVIRGASRPSKPCRVGACHPGSPGGHRADRGGCAMRQPATRPRTCHRARGGGPSCRAHVRACPERARVIRNVVYLRSNPDWASRRWGFSAGGAPPNLMAIVGICGAGDPSSGDKALINWAVPRHLGGLSRHGVRASSPATARGRTSMLLMRLDRVRT